MVIFPEAPIQGTDEISSLVNSQGEFRILWLPPGRYSFIAVERLENNARRDPEVLERLKALAMPVTLVPGDSRVLRLTLSRF